MKELDGAAVNGFNRNESGGFVRFVSAVFAWTLKKSEPASQFFCLIY
jgi:hypothetical protein